MVLVLVVVAVVAVFLTRFMFLFMETVDRLVAHAKENATAAPLDGITTDPELTLLCLPNPLQEKLNPPDADIDATFEASTTYCQLPDEPVTAQFRVSPGMYAAPAARTVDPRVMVSDPVVEATAALPI